MTSLFPYHDAVLRRWLEQDGTCDDLLELVDTGKMTIYRAVIESCILETRMPSPWNAPDEALLNMVKAMERMNHDHSGTD
jgi:hypothetical protein